MSATAAARFTCPYGFAESEPTMCRLGRIEPTVDVRATSLVLATSQITTWSEPLVPHRWQSDAARAIRYCVFGWLSANPRDVQDRLPMPSDDLLGASTDASTNLGVQMLPFLGFHGDVP
jgi:hypothetical protein